MLIQTYQVQGMSCAACSSKVEKSVSSIKGVFSADVELMKNTCTVEYDETIVNDTIIIAAIVNSGYQAKVYSGGNLYSDDISSIKKEKHNLVICFVLTFFLLLLSMGHIVGLMPISNAFYNALIQGVIAFIIICLQKKYFVSALNALKHFNANMDTLVSLGSLTSFIYSVFVLGTIELTDACDVLYTTKPIFFEGAAGILTFVAFGKFIESRAKHKTTNAISALYDLAPKTVLVKKNNEILTLLLNDISVGDIIIAKQGQRLGVDGVVVQGTAYIDESAITGESKPCKKIVDSSVVSATTVTQGYIEVKVTAVGSDTTLSKIIQLVENTAKSKVPIARIADIMASYFVPFVLLISSATFCYWFFVEGLAIDKALSFAISVLVISCPCALGLATPVAITAGTGKAAANGIIFKTPESMEVLPKINCFAFDKTGTLTKGIMTVSKVIVLDPLYQEKNACLIAASLEKKSPHPLATAIVNKIGCENTFTVDNFSFSEGLGIEGKIQDKKYYIGNLTYLKSHSIKLSDDAVTSFEAFQNQGATVIVLFDDEKEIALFVIEDELKDDSVALIDKLNQEQFKTIMLTGDDEAVAKSIYSKVKINDYKAKLLPQEKFEQIVLLQKGGNKVVMVGDGINDSISLCQADIGIGLKGSADIALSSCDIVLLKNRMIDVYNAMKISKATIANIKQNLFWALVYNVIAIPVACGVLYEDYGVSLTPMLCSILMGLSSICVVTNALRLTFLKVEKTDIQEEVKAMKKTMLIDGMMCSHCVASVKKTLESISNVSNVEVDLDKKKATFDVLESTSNDMLTAAIESAGYKVMEIK